MLVPSKAVALLSMAKESHIRPYLVILRSARVLRVIENMNFTVVHCLCGDDFGILRHVSGSVDLTLVVNLNVDLDASLFVGIGATGSDSIRLVVQHILLEVSGVFRGLLWQFDLNSQFKGDLLKQFEGSFVHHSKYECLAPTFE